MADQRLPTVNADDGQWGDILNQFIKKEHHDTGVNNAANGGHKNITVQPSTGAAGTAPIKLTSGTLLGTTEAGAVEFNNDSLYFTQTTGTTRKAITTNDTNGNLPANNLIEGYVATATATGTTTLTVTSKFQQYFTGSTTQTVVMPVVSGLTIGQQWQINNSSTGVDTAGAITIQSSGLNTILVLPAGSYATLTCISNSGTGTSSWVYSQNTSHIAVSKTQPTSAVIGDLWIDLN